MSCRNSTNDQDLRKNCNAEIFRTRINQCFPPESYRPFKIIHSRTMKTGQISVASEIDRIEERKTRCKSNLERAEFRRRKEPLSEQDREVLEDEMNILNERLQKYEKDLQMLRGENRKNMLLSVALLLISALFYYTFIN